MAAAGAAGAGATLRSGTPAARAAEAARAGAPGGKAVPFYGAHQAGIATPTQEHVHFLALDVVSDSVGRPPCTPGRAVGRRRSR